MYSIIIDIADNHNSKSCMKR